MSPQSDHAQIDASFVYDTQLAIRDGHAWGDLVMELGRLIADDEDDASASTTYSFWAGEARELSATAGIGWPGVIALVGRAMREFEAQSAAQPEAPGCPETP